MKTRIIWLVSGIAISVALIVVFFLLHNANCDFLDLDTKWLIVAGVPILIALVGGGFIRSFKGFGIELETLLKDPVGEVSLTATATDALDEYLGDDKGYVDYLDQLTANQKARIQRLGFVSERRGYYGWKAVEEYLLKLPSLSHFEVKTFDSRFICLIPTRIVLTSGKPNEEKIGHFLKSLEDGKVREKYHVDAISASVTTNRSLVDILEEVRATREGFLPVVSKKGVLVGIVTTRAIEKRIADEVLAARGRQ
jgi:hypothetical protein